MFDYMSWLLLVFWLCWYFSFVASPLCFQTPNSSLRSSSVSTLYRLITRSNCDEVFRLFSIISLPKKLSAGSLRGFDWVAKMRACWFLKRSCYSLLRSRLRRMDMSKRVFTRARMSSWFSKSSIALFCSCMSRRSFFAWQRRHCKQEKRLMHHEFFLCSILFDSSASDSESSWVNLNGDKFSFNLLLILFLLL